MVPAVRGEITTVERFDRTAVAVPERSVEEVAVVEADRHDFACTGRGGRGGGQVLLEDLVELGLALLDCHGHAGKVASGHREVAAASVHLDRAFAVARVAVHAGADDHVDAFPARARLGV